MSLDSESLKRVKTWDLMNFLRYQSLSVLSGLVHVYIDLPNLGEKKYNVYPLKKWQNMEIEIMNLSVCPIRL